MGAGISYLGDATTFAMDFVYEPAVSDTWGDTPVEITASDGSVIPAGGHTVDNHFVFANARADVGASQAFDEWTFQLGVRVSSFDYRLEQVDHVEIGERRQTVQWTEWTPTWGARLELPGVELHYIGFASSASHFPWPGLPSWGCCEVLNPGSLQPGDVLAPPSGAIVTPDATTVTHRLQISLPIR